MNMFEDILILPPLDYVRPIYIPIEYTIRYRIVNGTTTESNVNQWISVAKLMGAIPSCFEFVHDPNLPIWIWEEPEDNLRIPLADHPWGFVVYEDGDGYYSGNIGGVCWPIDPSWCVRNRHTGTNAEAATLAHEMCHALLYVVDSIQTSICLDSYEDFSDCEACGFDYPKMCADISLEYPCTESFCLRETNTVYCFLCSPLCNGTWQLEKTRYFIDTFCQDVCPTTPPICTEGEYTCIPGTTTLAVCEGEKWVLYPKSEMCGYKEINILLPVLIAPVLAGAIYFLLKK
jgi:hypothetical protein